MRPDWETHTKITERLGRFDHHPDPAFDYCIEIECIEALTVDAVAGVEKDVNGLHDRIERAMTFRVGGDPDCVGAKDTLRQCETKVLALLMARDCADYRH